MRALIIGLVVLGAACSSGPLCSASTCNGCCDARGQCRTVVDSADCGRGGAACVSCGIGQSCVTGACMSTGSGGFSGGSSGSGGGVSGSGGGAGSTGGGAAAGGLSGVGGGAAGGVSGTGGGVSGTGGGTSGVDCSPVAVQVPTGGCSLNLVAPTNCQMVSFNANGVIELDYTTNTTFCEGPHKLYVAGSPVSTWTAGNVLVFSLTSGTHPNYAMTRNIGGYLLLTAADLAPLTTVNNQYYFRVESFYGTISELNTFIVR